MRGLYVHVPFCVRKCAYCDFYSVPGRSGWIDPFLDAVLTEARSHAGRSFRTLYIGGGTPSLLGPGGLRKLVDGLSGIFDLRGLSEATIEVNPDSATRELLQTAADSRIDRISIGLQSLSDRELTRAGRLHTAAQATAVVRLAKALGFPHVSADVIVGLPGQDWPSLRRTLEELAGLGLDHVSLYCLTLEPGTPLERHPPDDLPSDDAQADGYHRARSLLRRAGFEHYEISNFAKPGHACLHNLNYWRAGEYLGLGPAAASHVNGIRSRNAKDLVAYLRDPEGCAGEPETCSAGEKLAEEAMLRLRLLEEGVEAVPFLRRTPAVEGAELIGRLERMAREGALRFDGLRYRLAPSRVLTANPIFAQVLWG
ncbi:MAG: radical SAM family heme chaperone HemW [bacterium]